MFETSFLQNYREKGKMFYNTDSKRGELRYESYELIEKEISLVQYYHLQYELL